MYILLLVFPQLNKLDIGRMRSKDEINQLCDMKPLNQLVMHEYKLALPGLSRTARPHSYTNHETKDPMGRSKNTCIDIRNILTLYGPHTPLTKTPLGL
jgi:hypothetical protein